MALVFQPGVFQVNVFQTEALTVDGGTANLAFEITLKAHYNVAPPSIVIGVGSGTSGFTYGGKLKLPRMTMRMPSIEGPLVSRPTAPRRPPENKLVKLEPEPTEEQLTEERWRTWQASPAAAGKGSASMLEFLVWEFLVKKKKQIEGVDFIYQYPLAGGRTQFGGFVADFYFPVRMEVWNPAGQQFHWTKPRDRARDILSRAVLAGRGIKEIFLWEEDMLTRPDYVLEQAWRGRELPHGVV